MKRATVAGIITAIIMILTGIAVCTAVLVINGFNFAMFDTTPEKAKKVYDCQKNLSDIKINTVSDDIRIVPYEGEEYRVEYYEDNSEGYSIEQSGETLSIGYYNTKKWYEFINMSFSEKEQWLTVYVPKGYYPTITIDAVSGDISAENITLGSLELVTTSGDIETSGLICTEFGAKTASGEISLKDITLEGALDISSTSGDCELDIISAKEIALKTVSGNIEARIAFTANFEFETIDGETELPQSYTNGIPFKIKTTSGDVEVEYR